MSQPSLPVESPTSPLPSQERKVSVVRVLAGVMILSVLLAVVVGNLQLEKANLQTELAQLQSDIAELNGQLHSAGLDASSLRLSIAQLQSRVTQLQSRLDSLESENSLLLSRNSELRSQVDALQEELDQLRRVYVSGVYFSGAPVYVDTTLVYFANLACTGSMRPTFDCDDAVLLYQPRYSYEIQVEDVVVYRIPVSDPNNCSFEGRYIIHRVVRFDGTYYWFKGDANSSEDDCGVTFGLITAKVIGIIYDAN